MLRHCTLVSDNWGRGSPKANWNMRGSCCRPGQAETSPRPHSSTKHPVLDQVPSFLQTKVTALSGKPVGAQYLPSYLSLSSWYSPSQCYLQLQPPSRPLQVRVSGVCPLPLGRMGLGSCELVPLGGSAHASAGLLLVLMLEPLSLQQGGIPQDERPCFNYGEHLGCIPGFAVINLALSVLLFAPRP